ncbi:MAG: isoamylase early set domain-containing protein [Anaerolineae bacterium]|nr:isoamylase early set domain-containing protein [Anaerolineae bacterium]
MITKTHTARKNKIHVTFELPTSVSAQQISVAGEFNGWDTGLFMDRRHPGGNWMLTVELEAGRRYRFRYLVDGHEWLNDWYADDHVENPFGSYDSVVDLTLTAPPPLAASAFSRPPLEGGA